jgi:hypothetical protein
MKNKQVVDHSLAGSLTGPALAYKHGGRAQFIAKCCSSVQQTAMKSAIKVCIYYRPQLHATRTGFEPRYLGNTCVRLLEMKACLAYFICLCKKHHVASFFWKPNKNVFNTPNIIGIPVGIRYTTITAIALLRDQLPGQRWSPLLSTRAQSTDHGLIPARNASLAAMHGSAGRSKVRYCLTWKHSTLNKKKRQSHEHAWCLQLAYESLLQR